MSAPQPSPRAPQPSGTAPRSSTAPRLLLTGATGVLGRALVDELRSEFALVCLVRKDSLGDPVVHEVRGDVTDPYLGLGRAAHARLARQLDAVVHCAAETTFAAAPEAIQRRNIEGTRHVLALANQAEVPLYHVSTAFVARSHLAAPLLARPAQPALPAQPRSSGRPDRRAASAAGPQAYLDSKIRAEQLVRGEARRAVIVRPSIVGGHSRTGRVARHQALHTLVGAFLSNGLPLLPADAQDRIDFLPQDVVAAALGRLIRAQVHHGDYWLTAGEQALTLGRLLDLAEGFADATAVPVPRPRLVHPGTVDRLVLPLIQDLLPGQLQRRFEELLALMPIFKTAEPFPSSLGKLGLADRADQAELAATFCRTLESLGRARRRSQVPVA